MRKHKRTNKEREQELQPVRIETCKQTLENLGFEITFEDKTSLKFLHNGNTITLFPYSGWHTGKGIVDGRGFGKLLKQLKPIKQ